MNGVLKLSWQIADDNKGRQNGQDHNDNSSNTITTGDDRARLQALALINDCYKFKMDLTTNGVVITDAIRFVQANREKVMSDVKGNGSKESKDPDYDEDKEQLEEKQEEVEKQQTTNHVF
jgi:hypothetical protein